MNLIWHIVWKDLQRLRVPATLWVLVIAMKLGLGFRLLRGIGGFRAFDRIASAGNWLIGIEMLAGFLLVAAVLHEDVVVGSSAFWMTRPISNGRMLAAKTFVLGIIFGVLPFLATLPWWLTCGYGVREILLAAAETWLWQGLVVLLAFPLVTLTGEFSRFLLWSFAVMVALSVMAMIIIAGSGSWPDSEQSVNTAVARAALGAIVFCIGGVAAAMHQYFRRHVFRSLWFVGFGVATSLLLVGNAQVGRVLEAAVEQSVQANGKAPVTSERSNSAAKPIALAFRAATLWELTEGNSDRAFLSVSFSFENVPEGHFLRAGNAVQSWSWPEGFTLRQRGEFTPTDRPGVWFHELGIKPYEPDPAFLKWYNERAVRSGRTPMSSTPEEAGQVGSVGAIVPRAFETRARLLAPSYQLHLDARLMRAALIGERRVQVGEVFKDENRRTRIAVLGGYTTSSKDKNSSVQHRTIQLVETEPVLRADRGWFIGVGTLLRFVPRSTVYFLLNRTQPLMYTGEGGDRVFSMVACFATVEVRCENLDFIAPRRWVDERWQEEAGWFDGPLTLAKMEAKPQTWFARDLTVERFEFKPPESMRGTP